MKKEKIKELIKNYKKDRDNYLEEWKRAKADLINYKNEEKKRVADFTERERRDLLLKFLEILDNFKRAEKEAQKREEKDELVNGFLKIKDQIESFLKEEGVSEMKAKGEEFDPLYHEAIETVDAESEKSGMVVEEVQKGYLLNGKVIRPSRVKVTK